MGGINCWEYMQCGRELGGSKSAELGICPASTNTMLEGIHNGVSAGRACWVVAGTMCEGKVQGSFAQKYRDCGLCKFYTQVHDEEGDDFLMTLDLLKMLKGEADH